jgi:hypothetical protein
VLLYTTDTAPAAYTPTVPGAYTDYGGISMSTTNSYLIQTAVQEYINFAVPAGNLTLGSGPGPIGILMIDQPYTVNQTYTTTTNAQNGETVRLKGPSLTYNANVLQTVTSRVVLNSTTNQFGICIQNPTNTIGNLAPDAQYSNGATACSTTSSFAMDTTATGTTYGDTVLASTAPTVSAGTVTYGAQVGATQTSGIYAATHSLIATGSF